MAKLLPGSETVEALVAGNQCIKEDTVLEILKQARRPQEDNPYLFCFKNEWELKLAESPAMQKVVEHIITAGTDFNESNTNWFFYHNTLSLLTAKETKVWVQEAILNTGSCLSERGMNHCVAGVH